MTDDAVADSTDWLATPLASLAAVESALRCQVCKDFYETPMITSCSHTFCSLCIRRALSSDQKCPLCRAGEQEMKLRSNWAMEEAVQAFKLARPKVMELAQRKEAVVSPKRMMEDVNGHEEPQPKRLRMSARLSRTRSSQAAEVSSVEVEEDYAEEPEIDVPEEEDDDFVPDDGLVPCPICHNRMKEWQVYTHIESCSGPSESAPKPAKSKAIPRLGSSQRQQSDKRPERLAALNYSMYKEAALRKKLADMGIPNQGPRHLLERRHKEWTMLWNANCDAAQPKSRSELLKDLDIWERTQGGRAPVTGRAAQNAAIIKDKDFDGSAWAAQHDNSFKDLIANARKSRLEAKKKVEESGEGEQQRPETEAEPNPAPPQHNGEQPDAVVPDQVQAEALTSTDWNGQYDPQAETGHRACTMPP